MKNEYGIKINKLKHIKQKWQMHIYELTSLDGSTLGFRTATTVPSDSFHNFSCTAPKRKRLTHFPVGAPVPTLVRSVSRQTENILLFRLRRGGIFEPITHTRTVVFDWMFNPFDPVASLTNSERSKTRRLLVRVAHSSEEISGCLNGLKKGKFSA